MFNIFSQVLAKSTILRYFIQKLDCTFFPVQGKMPNHQELSSRNSSIDKIPNHKHFILQQFTPIPRQKQIP
jgi:hypothetical protein